jgi:hypothetical protein
VMKNGSNHAGALSENLIQTHSYMTISASGFGDLLYCLLGQVDGRMEYTMVVTQVER